MKRVLICALVVCLSLLEGGFTHGVNSLVPYEGLVSSRARLLTSLDTTNKQIMGRAALISTEALSSIRLVIANVIAPGPAPDTGTGANMTCTASIEYNGAFTQETWSSATSITIADGALAFGDYVTVAGGIPANTIYYARMFCTSTGGVIYFNASSTNNFFSEATDAAVSGLSDQTMGGTISNTQIHYRLPPFAVLAQTIKPSVIVVGDSIAQGVNDIEDGNLDINEYDGKLGIITRSLGAVPFLNLASSGETAQLWTTRATARKQMIPKGSELITEMGTNDIYVNSRTSAQLTTDLQGIWALARGGEKVYQSCLIPDTTSTDGFVTLVNQTAVTGNTTRVTFNTAARSGISGMTGFYDTCIALESSQNSGLTIVTPTPPYTSGVHPTFSGYALVPPSGAIGPVTYP